MISNYGTHNAGTYQRNKHKRPFLGCFFVFCRFFGSFLDRDLKRPFLVAVSDTPTELSETGFWPFPSAY